MAIEVTKTLVIGLGSTGAEICHKLAERIGWEMQIEHGRESIKENVPWVRFLCIETNTSGKPRLIEPEDFLHITISADEWQRVRQFPDAYDESIRLKQWADMKTLEQLHDNSITAGAGNIRMVGRIAFLYPTNFERVHIAVNNRLASLQNLHAFEATQRLPEARRQKEEKVFFTGNGGVPVIYVVGTLCGGTCSGIVSDFGFFLRSKTEDEQYKIGFFTLPRHDLTPAMEDRAERLKKNAYAALVELNQYYYTSSDRKITIVFPDGTTVENTSTPYDYLFIAAPRALGGSSLDQLHTAIAECIFLNIFAPQTLPMAMGVDAAVKHETLTDADYQSHVFCTFGLSTLEFPAQRIADACTYRFASEVLGEWMHDSSNADIATEARKAVGSWEDLSKRFGLVTKLLDVIRSEQAKRGPWNISALEESIQEEHKSIIASLHKSDYDACRQIAEEIIRKVRERVVDYIQSGAGFALANQFLSEVNSQLSQLKTRAFGVSASVNFFEEIPELISQLYHVTSKKGLFSRPNHSEVSRWLDRLSEAWTNGLSLVADVRLARALLGNEDTEGILSRVGRAVQLYRARFQALEERMLMLKVHYDRQASSLSASPPEVNGEVIWEHDVVDAEYKQAFITPTEPFTDWMQNRKHQAHEIIRNVMQIIEEDIIREPSASDWLLQHGGIAEDPSALLPQEMRDRLLQLCRKPFLNLHQVNVLDRWAQTAKPELIASSVWEKSTRFLDLDTVVAKAGGFPDIVERQVLLRPNSLHAAKFESLLAAKTMGAWSESPTPSRIIVANYSFRFPLRGVPSVTGPNGIAFSSPKEKRLFFSRKDVAWVGLTEKELEKIRTAETLVALALLLDIIVPKDGRLRYDTGIDTPAGRQVIELPFSLREAAVHIASQDKSARWMRGLQANIEGVRAKFADGEWDSPFLEELVSRLKNGNGAEVQDWDAEWVGAQIARYCSLDEKLRKAYAYKFQPHKDIRNRLWHNAGDILAKGQTALKDGYYCDICGGLIGSNEAEAAYNEWRCQVDRRHSFM